jgi:hypothetical protein
MVVVNPSTAIFIACSAENRGILLVKIAPSLMGLLSDAPDVFQDGHESMGSALPTMT